MPRFEIDPTASLMSVDGRSSLHPIHAETSGLQGWIDAEVLGGGTGQVEVDAGRLEIPLTQLFSGNRLYDAELHRRIDIRRYPTVTAVLSDWQPTGRPGSYRVRGDICFRGVTRGVEDDMALSVEDDHTVVLDGARVFDIRDFGMDPPRLLTMRVFPEVTIGVAVVGRRIG
jgi:polyisoprenoid-binding protein YceI